jgi:hypothetical protein
LSGPDFKRAIDRAVGLDGRQLRKAVVAACAAEPGTALDPGKLRGSALIEAIEQARAAQVIKEAG